MERLPPQPWMTAPSARAVIAALEAEGGQGCARFVGGCVRDTLLGRGDEVTDVDIATPLTPPQVIAALKAVGLKAVPTGIEHGTVTAVSDHKPYEITTLRRDVETDGRRAVVAFTTDWAEDAQRRDFRLNALYADPDGTLHDPTGGGLEDVAARRIVFVGDPETRIREDYLRILRFFRFLARVGDAAQADPVGLDACSRLKDGVVGLSGERIQQELFKLLDAPDPVPAVRLMSDAGVLAEVLPGADGVDRLAGLVSDDSAFGPSDALLRFASLLPDTTEASDAAATRLRLSNADRLRLIALRQVSLPSGPLTNAYEARVAVHAWGATAVFDHLRLASAMDGDRAWPQAFELAGGWSPPPFPVTGEDIKAQGVPEGPDVGRVRAILQAWWVRNDFPTDKGLALAELKSIIAATPK